MIAHRGGAALAPENTLAAFDNALALDSDGLELDVRLSADGVAVVHHDRTLERTTALRGVVSGYTAAQLAEANVPSLASVLARYPSMRIVIELKANSIHLADAVIDVVRTALAVDRVCLGSFGTRVLRAVRHRAPEIATSAAREEVRWSLYRSWLRCPARRLSYGGYQVPEFSGRTRIVSRRFIDDAHRAGLQVQVWTVNTEVDARRLLDWGVDALITDRPDLLLPLTRSRRS